MIAHLLEKGLLGDALTFHKQFEEGFLNTVVTMPDYNGKYCISVADRAEILQNSVYEGDEYNYYPMDMLVEKYGITLYEIIGNMEKMPIKLGVDYKYCYDGRSFALCEKLYKYFKKMYDKYHEKPVLYNNNISILFKFSPLIKRVYAVDGANTEEILEIGEIYDEN